MTTLLQDLVSSTLSDPYLSYAAALYALAGPLHGYVALFRTSSYVISLTTNELSQSR